MCIVILLALGFCSKSHGYCTQGDDGNWYTDETAEDTFMNVDPTKGPMDFRLKPGSCAIDRGMTIPEVTHDFDGVLRPKGSGYDIGAFEHVLIDKTPPQAPKDLKL
jgi:hypothetical protein